METFGELGEVPRRRALQAENRLHDPNGANGPEQLPGPDEGGRMRGGLL